jgi:hypothetical protein
MVATEKMLIGGGSRSGGLSGGVILLTAEWVWQPAIIEADYSTIISMLRAGGGERMHLTGVLKELQAACALLPQWSMPPPPEAHKADFICQIHPLWPGRVRPWLVW